MAQSKTIDANSVSKEKTAKVSGNVGRPNQSVAAIREQFKLEEERQIKHYANAKEDKVMRTIRDLTRTPQTPSLTKTDKETIRGYLTGNIYSNGQSLINASRYLFYRSPIYQKMIYAYVDMYCLDCRKIIPDYSFVKGMDATKASKQFEDTVNFMEILGLQNNMVAPLTNMWIEDISFNLFFTDDTGSMVWHINSNEAVIDTIYTVHDCSCFGMALDMSKWRSAQRQELIEWLGSPLKEMWDEYQKTGTKYIHVPAEYSLVLKFRTDLIDAIIPPLLPQLLGLANLNDLTDVQASADELSFYKMIYMPLPTITGAKNPDEFEVTPDLAIDYFDIVADEAIPANISTAVVPGKELKTIEFSDNVSDDVNRVEQSQQQILGSAGGVGALLNGNKLMNNSALITAALKAESAYVLNSVLPQINAWTNLQLLLNVSNPCKVDLMPVTIFTKADYRESLLEANQYSYAYRLAYGTLLGFSEKQTMAQLKFENEVLGLPSLMQYPLQSSYTTSNNGTVGEGAPQKDETELSPEGERSRNR